MKEKIYKIFSEVFEITESEVHDDLSQDNFEQWDSIMHLTLISEIEGQLDVSLEPEEIEKMTSLLDVIQICTSKKI